jgi:hypothetical protein
VLLAAGLALLAGCGGSDDSGKDQSSAKDQSSVKVAIQRWFTAARLGKASQKCALESIGYQVVQYQRAGRACLASPANNQPQPVWAKRVVIEKVSVSGRSATATVQPNAGSKSEATVGLSRDRGRWLIDSLQ